MESKKQLSINNSQLFFILISMILGLMWLPSEVKAAEPNTHVVQYGETLTQIAFKYNVSLSALITANGLGNPNFIYTGQVLRLPSGGTVSGEVTHVVKPGETLAGIAYHYGVSLNTILAYNSIGNPNIISVGRVLRWPQNTSVSPPPAPAPVGNKRIVVDLSDQRTYAYQNGQLLYNFIVSTGEPGRETAVGKYKVQNKLPNAYASTWNLQMPYWLGIYWAGHLQNGFHALPILSNGQLLWEGYLGTPVSYGCIILSSSDAKTLYNWAEVGTDVIVQW